MPLQVTAVCDGGRAGLEVANPGPEKLVWEGLEIFPVEGCGDAPPYVHGGMDWEVSPGVPPWRLDVTDPLRSQCVRPTAPFPQTCVVRIDFRTTPRGEWEGAVYRVVFAGFDTIAEFTPAGAGESTS